MPFSNTTSLFVLRKDAFVVNGRLLVFWFVESSEDDQNSQQPAHVDVDS
jgi:hypothetical protein